jgi:hypothetical protein
MNNLVRSLAMQNERIWNLYQIGPVQRAEVQQFVEAIVRECATWIETTDADPAIGKDDANALLKHFGVEE